MAQAATRTWYTSITLDARSGEGSTSARAASRRLPTWRWVGSYRVYGSTFELTELTVAQRPAAWYRSHRDLLTATFTFDGTTLTLTPVGSWPCWSRVAWTLHPWTLTKKAP